MQKRRRVVFIISLCLLYIVTIFSASCQQKEKKPIHTVVQTLWKDELKNDPQADLEGTSKIAIESINVRKKASPPIEKLSKKKPPPLKRYSVQIGAFEKKDNADRLLKKFQKKGYDVFSVTSKDKAEKQWIMVRIGSFKDKMEALELAGIITNKENTNAIVLRDGIIQKIVDQQTDQKKPIKSTSKPKARSKKSIDRFEYGGVVWDSPNHSTSQKGTNQTGYTFQAGGLFKKSGALQLQKKLRAEGYQTVIKKKSSQGTNEIWYTVRVGYFFSLEAAERAATKFQETTKLQTSIAN
ncbi:MAG: SPOR domain-containing protein [Deltaproteobacteria bacterium]|nr:SPOR domain-containing protein [Deltaproteobacteria bacterium]